MAKKLQYLWCDDEILMPPHCPFDNVIISNLSGCKGIRWTSLDDITQYKCIVNAATAACEKAGSESLAQWELETCNLAWG